MIVFLSSRPSPLCEPLNFKPDCVSSYKFLFLEELFLCFYSPGYNVIINVCASNITICIIILSPRIMDKICNILLNNLTSTGPYRSCVALLDL